MRKNYFLFILVIFILKVSAQELFQESPVNHEFEEYIKNPDDYSKIHFTKDGYPIGGLIPRPVILDYTEFYKNKDNVKEVLFDAKYDLRDVSHNWVTLPKNQGDCGACWTFATMGAIESNWKKNGLGTFDLSEDNLNNCNNFLLPACQGGNIDMATAYLVRRSGPMKETDDPYNDYANPCPTGLTQVAYVADARWLPKDVNTIKQALIDHGALFSTMCWDDNSYRSSDKTYYYSGSDIYNHAVLLVGWDDNKVTAASAKGAWIVKNSWGTSWGENGYFYISYSDTKHIEDGNVCYYINRVANVTGSKVYYYDENGFLSKTGSGNTGYGISKFVCSSNQKIQKIGTYVNSSNSTVSVEIYDNFNGTTLSSLLGSISDKNSPSPGYYTFDVPTTVSIKTGNDFYVKIKYYSPGNNMPVSTEKAIQNFASPTIETSKCWVSTNGTTWTPVGTGTQYLFDLTIKAYAIPDVSEIESHTSLYGVNVYPTPSSGKINIEIHSDKNEHVTLSIYNILGDLIYSERNISFIGTLDKNIDLGHPRKGMYLLKIETAEGALNKRIVIE